MRGNWEKFAVCAAIFVLCAGFAAAQRFQLFAQTAPPDYDQVLAQQPPGLKLTMTLSKDHFYQGEIIEATLTYTYTGKDLYMVWLASGDRSGRVQNVRFFGHDENGAAVDDPIGWIYFQGFFGGGMVRRGEGPKNLGTASITLTINQWLRFDHPGTYTIFADTTSVHPGTEQAMNFEESAQVVSNKVTVTITSLAPDEEKRIIADAMQKIEAGSHQDDSPQLSADQNEDNAHEKAYAVEPFIELLRYLQTPAARAALRSRLDKTPEYMLSGGHFEMEAALMGAPDRPKEAALILDDVEAGRLKADNSLVGLYSDLKTYPLAMADHAWNGKTLTVDEIPQRMAAETAWDKARTDAQKEILAAAKEASSKTGVSDLDLIWTAFLTNPFDPEYRAPVVAHQLDFSHERQLQLLSLIEGYFCRRLLPSEKDFTPDFLPLVRLYLGSPAYNRDALMILSYARPDEARDIALMDLASSQPHYLNNEGQSGKLAVTLLENPQIKWTEEQKRLLDDMRHR